MSESTEELTTAVKGSTEALTELETLTNQLSAFATELAEEASGHGWHGMGTRMEEAADALTAAAGELATGRQASETAGTELGLINDKSPPRKSSTT